MIAEYIETPDRATHIKKGQVTQHADRHQTGGTHIDACGKLATPIGVAENTVKQRSIGARDFDQPLLPIGRQMAPLVHMDSNIVGMVAQFARFPRNKGTHARDKVRANFDGSFCRPQRTLQTSGTYLFERRILRRKVKIQASRLHTQPLGNIAHPRAMIALRRKNCGSSIKDVLATGITMRFDSHRVRLYHQFQPLSNNCLTVSLTVVRY